jgi:hypothetical protein
MSRYIMIRRLRGPAFLLLVGALALLNQADILTWGKSWPFFLILAGLLKLAERRWPRKAATRHIRVRRIRVRQIPARPITERPPIFPCTQGSRSPSFHCRTRRIPMRIPREEDDEHTAEYASEYTAGRSAAPVSAL